MMMVVIHANDTTTGFLSRLYDQREDVSVRIAEGSTNEAVRRALREGDTVMMLGHGNPFGLFSAPSKNGRYERFLITDSHVQFLRDKTCIGIWCHADQFAQRYQLHGLFSGMIISELQETIDYGIEATKDEIDREMVKFAQRLRHCIDNYDLEEVPMRMKELDDVKSPLTTFNYDRLYYY